MCSEKDNIIRKPRENGCRITEQREIILDIILKNLSTRSVSVNYLKINLLF